MQCSVHECYASYMNS